jgi:hypothetical protein
VSTGARWHTVALGWIAAVVVTMLIAAWAISIVGHQLSSTVTIPKSATSDSSQRLAPSTTPRPRPSAKLTPRQHNGAGSVAGPLVAAASVDGVASVPRAVAGTGAGDGSGSGTSEPPRRRPATRPAPAARPPSLVTDQRAVETDAGTAAFTCTSTDRMSLLYATSAPGYTTEPPRIRSASRIEVDFVGPTDQKIDARCDNGRVTYDVES